MSLPRSRSLSLALAAAALVLGGAGRAWAQRTVDAETWKPALDPFGVFAVDGAAVLGQDDLAFKVDTSYASNPLKLVLDEGGTLAERSVVAYRDTTDLQLAFGLTDWLELAVDAPFARQGFTGDYGQRGTGTPDPGTGQLQQTGFYAADGGTNVTVPTAQPMDTRVALKANLWGRGSLGAAAEVIASLPFGDPRTFSSSGLTVSPVGVVDLVSGRLTLALNGGVALRRRTTVYDPYATSEPAVVLSVGNEFVYGAGAAMRFSRHVGVGAELDGLAPLGGAGDTTVEGLAGLLVYPTADVTVALGGGGSVDGAAHRRDDGRLFLSVAWATGRPPSSGRLPEAVGAEMGATTLLPSSPELGLGTSAGPSQPAPPPDRDGDGIPDYRDKCPDQPETYNGYEDDDGCPDNVPGVVASGLAGGTPLPTAGEAVPLFGRIAFVGRTATLERASDGVLDQAATYLLAHPQLRQIRVEAHTDNRGSPQADVRLSEERAEVVRAYLVAKGVPGERLTTAGYGSSRPLVPNTSAANRAKNRRVDLIVVQ